MNFQATVVFDDKIQENENNTKIKSLLQEALSLLPREEKTALIEELTKEENVEDGDVDDSCE